MNKGRAKCERLKKIRKAVADRLHIDLHQTDCTFEGNCRGTCPKCRQEEEILNRELLKRAAGLGVGTLAGLSLTGCSPLDSGFINETTGAPIYEETDGAPLEEEVTTGEAPYEETDGAQLYEETDGTSVEDCYDEKEPSESGEYGEPAVDDAPAAGGEVCE